MAHSSLKNVGTRKKVPTTPQTKRAVKEQVRNDAGGYVFKIDPLEQIKRFLILGSEATAYRSGESLTLKNVKVLKGYLDQADDEGVIALIDLIVDVSVGGRAPKQDPAIFALAYSINRLGSDRRVLTNYAYSKLGEVARTGTTLFKFLDYLTQFQRIGMGTQKAIGRWFAEKDVDAIAYQMVKYRQREGWTPADVLRVSKRVKSSERPEISGLLDWATGKDTDGLELPSIVLGYELAKSAEDAKSVANIVKAYKLSWEMIPTQFLNEKVVWEALLDVGVPIGALIRQLPRLTTIGIISELGGRTQEIVEQLTDQKRLVRGRIHPLNILIAMKTYDGGRSLKGDGTWKPVRRITDALDKAFYLAFKAVVPSGKRFLIALDVSGSMGFSHIAGLPITPAEAVAALSLVTANVEPETYIVGFATQVKDLGISPSDSLQTVMRKTSRHNFGGTDTAAAIRFAREHSLDVDVFLVMTDNETWAGPRHTHEEMALYRRTRGIQAKQIVVGTTATSSSIADPNDPLTLDLVGFDTSTPQIISEFARGLD